MAFGARFPGAGLMPVDAADAALSERLANLARPSELGVRPTLDRMTALLKALKNPQKGLKVIHVGGTSGKGSVSALIAAALQEGGLKVGLHTKPHLQTVRERIVIDGDMISADALNALIDEVEPAVRKTDATWHETTVALALLAFKRAAVNVAVIEVGLGGTWDSTNLVTPSVAVLTNVGLDHREVLGDTVEEIARDKVGIIKPGALVISGVRQQSVQKIVAEKALQEGCEVWQLTRDIRVRGRRLSPQGNYYTLHIDPLELELPMILKMLGQHQARNAALAAAAALAFVKNTKPFQKLYYDVMRAIRMKFATTQAPGRFELFGKRPLIIVDGAHSPPKMTAIERALKHIYPDKRIVAVVASMRGHDVGETWKAIASRFDAVAATSVDTAADFGTGRALPAELVLKILRENGFDGDGVTIEEPANALKWAIERAGPDDIVLVTGSMYLAGALRDYAAGAGAEGR